MVLPGDEIAMSEEYICGAGTYERDGKIFAAVTGEVSLDEGEKVASVLGYNPPSKLKVGDVVLSAVQDIKNTMVTLSQLEVEGCERSLAGEGIGTLHISRVSDGRTDDIREAFRLGDVVRARVVQVRPSVQFTTAGPDLGVVKAFCTRCRAPLEPQKGQLCCENCERTERRKIAKGYSTRSFFAPGG